jgi:hypothetical protein
MVFFSLSANRIITVGKIEKTHRCLAVNQTRDVKKYLVFPLKNCNAPACKAGIKKRKEK